LEQLVKLAGAYEDCGNYRRAVALIKKAHDMATAVLGKNYRLSGSFCVDSHLERMARLYMKCGDMDQWVETAHLRYQRLCEQGEENLVVIHSALRGLVDAYEKTGRLQDAANLLEHGCALQVKRDGDRFIGGSGDSKWANDSLLNDLASIYVKLKNYDRAAPLCEKLYAIRQEVYGKEHNKTLNVMSWLAYVYAEAGQNEKALPLQREVYDLRVKVSGEEARATVTAMVNLGAMYEQVGDDLNAVVCLERALQYRSKTLGADHPDTESIRQWIASIQNK
jgi:tetratricopeptide (TPR) repeat protein